MKRGNLAAVLAILALVAVTGGGIWWFNNIYMPKQQAAKIAVLQIEEVPVQAETGTDYDYHIPVTPEAVQEAVAAKKPESESSVEVTTDENGDVWITRDWSNDVGLKETTPPSDSDSGAEANIAAGTATEIPFDENGAYSEPHPEATPAEQPKQDEQPAPTPAPEQKPASSSGSSTPKGGDIKYVDGQAYLYDTVFGWTPYGGPGVTEPSAGTSNGLSGVMVGEM